MNFAFVTVLILIISIPGIALRRSYFSAQFTLKGVSTDIINEILWSTIPAIFINGIAILLVEKYTPNIVKLNYFGYLIVGGSENGVVDKVFNNLHQNILLVLSYLAVVTTISIIIGHLSRVIVRYYGLDIKFSFFRFPNDWHYLVSGEYLDIEHGRNYHKMIDFILVEALVTLNDNKIIVYQGVLEDYFLSKKGGGLDRILIKYPSKKKFSVYGKEEFRDIPGNYLVIPYEKVMNINFTYFHLHDSK